MRIPIRCHDYFWQSIDIPVDIWGLVYNKCMQFPCRNSIQLKKKRDCSWIGSTTKCADINCLPLTKILLTVKRSMTKNNTFAIVTNIWFVTSVIVVSNTQHICNCIWFCKWLMNDYLSIQKYNKYIYLNYISISNRYVGLVSIYSRQLLIIFYFLKKRCLL